VIKEGARLHVGGLPIGPVYTHCQSLAWVDSARCAEWLGGLSACMPGLDA